MSIRQAAYDSGALCERDAIILALRKQANEIRGMWNRATSASEKQRLECELFGVELALRIVQARNEESSEHEGT